MWKIVLFNIAFALNCLLAFLLVFESGLSVPAWLQVVGRMHPLLLHIPIGLLLLYAIAELFFPLKKMQDAIIDLKDGLLLSSAATISLTAIMGLFLSREPGYDPDVISLHKWGGAAISFLLLAWYQWRKNIRRRPYLNNMVAALSIVMITFTGHQGGNITHGENFVLAPILPKEDDVIDVPIDEAVVFTHMVQPILKRKCISCHNEKKAKGELVMETAALMLKGGKNGKLWDTTANDLGLMLKRVHLPLDHDDHMPPKGKPQLTDTEITILEAWIKDGSNLTVKVKDLDKRDTLKALAAALFSEGKEETYAFEAVSQNTVESLNNFYRVIKPLAANSPALAAAFFGKEQFTMNQLLDLTPVNKQIVEMDLSRMPLKDGDLAAIAQFPNLRKLNLNFTAINGEGLASLKNLQHLQEISLSGSEVRASSLGVLKDFPALEKAYLWNTPVAEDEIAALQKTNKKISYESGYYGDTVVLKLTPPIINNERFVIGEPTELKLKHNINGVTIRYTLDGTEPDSVHSPLYNNDVILDKSVIVKAKAFRKGWISSDIQISNFYRSALKPKSVKLFVQPDRHYQASREKTLFDFELGGKTIESGKWIAYTKPAVFDALLDFESPVQGSSLTLNCFKNNRHIFPPESMTLWYGDDSLKMKKLETRRISAPAKDSISGNVAIIFNLPKEMFRYIRVQAVPLAKAPQWSSSKGRNGWLFIDEIVIN